ncbi:HTTM domain-containing protein [Marivirga sp. S37H4]|uniref:HTTM domain-containing protein n=1 Tax=Marivirga aurantiaca TaxID=2802615 RepID=A0A934X2U8_9BACT|nr:HTTM domain-containing protein [Marivirga aurantiaca]
MVIFRTIFGFLITAEAWGAIMTGWVRRAFIDPVMTFPFIDFSWLHPLPGNGMYFYFFIMGCFGVMVMLGYKYRLAIGSYTLMWSLVYFMQKTNYNNHYYLLVLLCFLMCFVPANRAFSLDAKYKPELKSSTCPNWCRLLFILQIGIVYTYAGIAKLNIDWLTAESIRMLLLAKKNLWLVGDLLQERWAHYFIAYGGVMFDLFITPLLLWKSTRKWAFITSIFFHLFNSAVFQVGIFPFMGIAMCIFFFDPVTIRRIFFKSRIEKTNMLVYPVNRPLLAALMVWVLIQLVLPSRHWLYDSNVHWSEEGHRLSWRMMLRSKSGHVNFKVVNPANDSTEMVDKSKYLTFKQQRVIATRPDMCWQFVQVLKKDYAERGWSDAEIYANGKVRLNNGLRQPLYDPERNLAKVEWYRFRKSDWLLPMEEDK